jgi:hypothetical protein
MASADQGHAFDARLRHMADDLVALLYHEDCPNRLTGAANRHESCLVVVGHRRGTIDRGLAELVEALWQAGLDTVSSCEDLAGSAYLQFASPVHGGDAFAAFLAEMGVPHLRADRPYEVPLVGVGRLQLDSVILHFPAHAVGPLTAAWKRAHPPGPGGKAG